MLFPPSLSRKWPALALELLIKCQPLEYAICGSSSATVVPSQGNGGGGGVTVGQDTLPTTVYVAAGKALSVCPLTKVWSTISVDRSLVPGELNVLPFTAPRRSPGGGFPTTNFGT